MMQDEGQLKKGQTLSFLIDSIEFNKPKKKKALSQTGSISSCPSTHTIDSQMKQKSKIWTEEQSETLELMLKKYGTDFSILSNFFPKKTKNQIKNKYKQLQVMRKKQEKEQGMKLMAMAQLFNQISEKQESN